MEVAKIRTIVYSAMNRLGMEDMRKFEKLETIAIEYYRDKIKTGGQSLSTKVVRKPLTDMKYIVMPDDYVSYTIVGIVLNGRIWTLGVDNKIPFLADLPPCSDSFQDIMSNHAQYAPTTGVYFSPQMQSGGYVNTMFATGGGFNIGYYREDWEKRIIQFDINLPQSEIYLEYISNGHEASGDAIVGPEFIPCIREEVILQEQRFNKKAFDRNDIAVTMQALENAEILARRAKSRPFYEMLDALYRGNGFNLK